MDVRNCKSCGRLFNYLSGNQLCPDCSRQLEDKFETVKQYIYDHPNASIQKVSEENDVSIQQLKTWVRQERLEFTEASLVGLTCEGCGATIRSGRFCQECKSKLGNALGNAYRKEVPDKTKTVQKSNAKMRFLDK